VVGQWKKNDALKGVITGSRGQG